MLRQIAHYGWIPDLPDQRDYRYVAPLAVTAALPSSVDLRSAYPPVFDQSQLGSCTANALAAAFYFEQRKYPLPQISIPSRLFIYYNARVIGRAVEFDSGAMLRDAIKSLATQGVCPEDMWPYKIAGFRDQPPAGCYQIALQHKAILYQRVTRDLNQMKGCLASGHPFVFGFTAYESFESKQVAMTGHAQLPHPGERVLGGQAVLAVGYEDAHQWFIVRNSWGEDWGMQGYFTLPYAYLLNPDLSDDFWTMIQVVE